MGSTLTFSTAAPQAARVQVPAFIYLILFTILVDDKITLLSPLSFIIYLFFCDFQIAKLRLQLQRSKQGGGRQSKDSKEHLSPLHCCTSTTTTTISTASQAPVRTRSHTYCNISVFSKYIQQFLNQFVKCTFVPSHCTVVHVEVSTDATVQHHSAKALHLQGSQQHGRHQP